MELWSCSITTDDPRLLHIKEKEYKAIIVITEKIKFNHILKPRRSKEELARIPSVTLPTK